jgi:hypothetical protein
MKRLILAIVVLVVCAAPSHHALAQKATTAAPRSAPTGIVGNWVGVLAVQGLKLRLALRVSSTGDGILAAKLDSIDQEGEGPVRRRDRSGGESRAVFGQASGLELHRHPRRCRQPDPR